MAGISSKAAGSLTNKYKFGGKELNDNEFSDGSGLELYDFSARNYDPHVGRFWGGDRKSDKLVQWSPYTYAVNNPILFVDPDGEFPWPIWARSFISANNVAGGLFRGDGRGPSVLQIEIQLPQEALLVLLMTLKSKP